MKQGRIQPVGTTVFQILKIQKMVWNYRELIGLHVCTEVTLGQSLQNKSAPARNRK